MPLNISELCVYPETSVRQAMGCIDRNRKGIVVVISQDGRLLGTITDGDIRRAMLAGLTINDPTKELLARKKASPQAPVSATVGTEAQALIQLMREHAVRQIPIVDSDQRVVNVVTFDDLLPNDSEPIQAVIMAGGLGKRLRPLTDDLPKPMLPIGGRPLIERIVDSLRDAGIKRINVTTHYRPQKIIEYFGDGHALGVELNYVSEDRPLGTAGSLGLIPEPGEPLLVINGDILTRVDFRSMMTYHREHAADMTVAVRKYEFIVPYGVVHCDGVSVQNVEEKPQFSVLINAGIYLLQPAVFAHITNGEPLEMPDLIQRLVDAGRPVVSFLVHEYWRDIGLPADYAQAQEELERGN